MRQQKEKKITFQDLADDLMFEVYKTMQFRTGLPEEGNMKKLFKKFFKKAIKINNPKLENDGTESTTD